MNSFPFRKCDLITPAVIGRRQEITNRGSGLFAAPRLCSAAIGVDVVVESENPIAWHEEWDDNDNSIWEGESPYYDDGSPFFWRLKQRLVENKIEWYAAHDAELGPEDVPPFDSLAHAKSECQKAHDHIIKCEVAE